MNMILGKSKLQNSFSYHHDIIFLVYILNGSMKKIQMCTCNVCHLNKGFNH